MQSEQFLKQIVLFIFVPESIVSVIFLVVLMGIGIYGIKNLKGLKEKFILRLETIEMEYDKQSKKIDPSVFLRMKLQEFEVSEYKITSIPNILVSVGILATFLGLGIALKQAAEILSSVGTVELTKLNSVLGIIAFKFQTSVWGLTLSILFQKFGIDYFVALKQNYQQNALETLYANKETGIEDLLQRQSLLVEEQLKEIRYFNNSISSLEQSSGSFAKSAIDFIQTTDSLKQVINEFSLTTTKSLNNIEERLEIVVNEQLEKINTMNEKTLDAHDQATNLLQVRLSNMEGAVENQLAAMYKQVDNLTVETRNVFIENMHTTNDKILASMDKIATQVTIVNEQSMKVQQDSTQIIKQALQSTTIQINEMLTHMDSNLNHTIKSTVESMSNMEGAVENQLAVMYKQVDHLIVETRNIFIENIHKTNNQMLTSMEKISNQTTIVNEQSMNMQQDSTQMIKQALQATAIQINKMLEHMDSNLNHTINCTVESVSKMQTDVVDNIKISLGKVNEDIRICLDGTSTTIDKFATTMDELHQNINTAFLSVSQQLTKLDECTNDFNNSNHEIHGAIGKLEQEMQGIATIFEKLVQTEQKLQAIHVSAVDSLEESLRLSWANNLLSHIEENLLDTVGNQKDDLAVGEI